MYHEIEGQLSIQPLIFDEEELIANGKHYPYEKIESLEITSAPLFSAYGILTIRTQGKEVPVPFVRSRKARLERALKEYERLAGRGELLSADKAKSAAGADEAPKKAGSADPYEEIKKLKELLDMEAITKEEYETKKKQLLDL